MSDMNDKAMALFFTFTCKGFFDDLGKNAADVISTPIYYDFFEHENIYEIISLTYAVFKNKVPIKGNIYQMNQNWLDYKRMLGNYNRQKLLENEEIWAENMMYGIVDRIQNIPAGYLLTNDNGVIAFINTNHPTKSMLDTKITFKELLSRYSHVPEAYLLSYVEKLVLWQVKHAIILEFVRDFNPMYREQTIRKLNLSGEVFDCISSTVNKLLNVIYEEQAEWLKNWSINTI